ncbi:MAG: DUF3095 domain-containing protein [Burkholderiales bacterium]|nr:DUF3095 domain-containing protein [Burkholderiales bacterium]
MGKIPATLAAPARMDTTSFYANLPLRTEFSDVGLAESYTPLPDSWHVAMCDVRNSTAAVEAGRYKSVNTLGAAVITGMLNAAGDTDIPFVFEGDGAMLCVPPQLLDAARAVLLRTRELAQKSFGLDLRIATLPVARIREAGSDILVGRFRVSEHYVQAMFAGGGMAFADRYMKDPATAALCRVEDGSVASEGNFDGLECRWQDIPSRHGETVSVMVKVLVEDREEAGRLYRELVARVREIYGADDACHPVWPPNLSFTFSGRRLGNEVGVRAADRGAWGRWLYLTRTRAIVLLGWFLMRFGIRTARTDWGRYKTVLARNSDVRKFNDCYRQVLAGNARQRQELTAWLEERFARRELVYGVHAADRAQMTCLVFDYSGRHLHFIDGAEGGLSMAAKALKERVAKLG